MSYARLFGVCCFLPAISAVMTTTEPLRSADRPVTVCEVLTNLDLYRGKVITIRAILRGGRHGEFLQDGYFDEPCE